MLVVRYFFTDQVTKQKNLERLAHFRDPRITLVQFPIHGPAGRSQFVSRKFELLELMDRRTQFVLINSTTSSLTWKVVTLF